MRVDFEILVKTLLPYHKRQLTRLKWLSVFSEKAKTVMNYLVSARDDANKALNVNGQTRILESHLNSIYGPGVQIVHTAEQTLNIGLLADGEQNYLSFGFYDEDPTEFQSVALQGESQEQLTHDYIIIAPAATDKASLRSEADKYRLAGKSFDIIT
jgi:hypothetical protein